MSRMECGAFTPPWHCRSGAGVHSSVARASNAVAWTRVEAQAAALDLIACRRSLGRKASASPSLQG